MDDKAGPSQVDCEEVASSVWWVAEYGECFVTRRSYTEVATFLAEDKGEEELKMVLGKKESTTTVKVQIEITERHNVKKKTL